MIHMRLEDIFKSLNLSPRANEALKVLRNPLEETQESLAEAYKKLEDMEEVQSIVTEVYKQPGTDMGDIWVSFL